MLLSLISDLSLGSDQTGKYVLAPGVREEFGVDAVGGMVDLIAFFNAPWPPSDPCRCTECTFRATFPPFVHRRNGCES